MFVVTGASGKTGGAVATALLNIGQRVRVVVRTQEKGSLWAARGAEVSISAIEDEHGLKRALEGAEAAYFIVPPNIRAHNQMEWYRGFAEHYRDVLTVRPLSHAVVLSALGAHRIHPFGQLREMERTIRNVSTPITFLRASFFMENFDASLKAMQAQSTLACFLDPDLKIPMVACKDIGELAATLMIQGPGPTEVVELKGPKDYSFRDAADAFGVVLGKHISPVRIPDDQIVSSVVRMGASEEFATFYRGMYESFARGLIGPEGGDVPVHLGRMSLQDEAHRLVIASRTAYLG